MSRKRESTGNLIVIALVGAILFGFSVAIIFTRDADELLASGSGRLSFLSTGGVFLLCAAAGLVLMITAGVMALRNRKK